MTGIPRLNLIFGDVNDCGDKSEVWVVGIALSCQILPRGRGSWEREFPGVQREGYLSRGLVALTDGCPGPVSRRLL